MTDQDFIKRIKDQKQNAHALLAEGTKHNIIRGMAHSIHGFVEDLFSVFIATKINRDSVSYYVDKVISLRLNKDERAKSFKPDLMVIEKEMVTHYFDVKTDIGWNRDLEDYLKEKNNFINSIRGQKAWIKTPEKVVEVTISNNIKYEMVIVFGWNINQKQLQTNLNIASSLENVEVYVLYSKSDENSDFAISDYEFERLNKSIEIGR